MSLPIAQQLNVRAVIFSKQSADSDQQTTRYRSAASAFLIAQAMRLRGCGARIGLSQKPYAKVLAYGV